MSDLLKQTIQDLVDGKIKDTTEDNSGYCNCCDQWSDNLEYTSYNGMQCQDCTDND